jgi:hypothetical protein
MASTQHVRRLHVTLAAAAVAIVLFASALTCAGGNALAFHRRLSQRPIVWHAGRLAVSAEITVNPGCAPLAQTCWVQHPAGRPRYFSAWVYRSTPPNIPWQLSKWHVLVVRVGREEG